MMIYYINKHPHTKTFDIFIFENDDLLLGPHNVLPELINNEKKWERDREGDFFNQCFRLLI